MTQRVNSSIGFENNLSLNSRRQNFKQKSQIPSYQIIMSNQFDKLHVNSNENCKKKRQNIMDLKQMRQKIVKKTAPNIDFSSEVFINKYGSKSYQKNHYLNTKDQQNNQLLSNENIKNQFYNDDKFNGLVEKQIQFSYTPLSAKKSNQMTPRINSDSQQIILQISSSQSYLSNLDKINQINDLNITKYKKQQKENSSQIDLQEIETTIFDIQNNKLIHNFIQTTKSNAQIRFSRKTDENLKINKIKVKL